MSNEEIRMLFPLMGIFASLVLLMCFLLLQRMNSPLLQLHTKWIIVSGLPLIVALFVGGFIHRFSGFGFEIESVLGMPVGNLELKASDFVEELPAGDKRSSVDLFNMAESEKLAIQRLSFVYGLRGVYEASVVSDYMRELRRLEFLEIREDDDSFVCLIPIGLLEEDHWPNTGKIQRFLRSLEERTLRQEFLRDAIWNSIGIWEDLEQALPKVRASKYGMLPVLSDDRVVLGVITRRAIESRIANEVIAAGRRGTLRN